MHSLACLQVQLCWPVTLCDSVHSFRKYFFDLTWVITLLFCPSAKTGFFVFFILEERTYLISKEYKLMSRWSLFILVAFSIPWVCSVQMCAYTGLCKHTLIHAPACFCGYDNTMDLPYPLFSPFHNSSTLRAQLLWFCNSYPGAHLSKLFCSELHFLGVGSKHLRERQPKFWSFSFWESMNWMLWVMDSCLQQWSVSGEGTWTP